MEDSIFLSSEPEDSSIEEEPAPPSQAPDAQDDASVPPATRAPARPKPAARRGKPERAYRSRSRSGHRLTLAAAAIAAVGIGAFLVWFGAKLDSRERDTSRAATASHQTTAPAQDPGAQAQDHVTVPSSGAQAPPPETTAPAPSTPTAEVASPSAEASASPVKPPAPKVFALEVATFIIQERAQSECDLLAESTNLKARLRTRTGSDGVVIYRVLLGRFDDEQAAETAADDLLTRGLVSEARVISFTPRSSRPR